MRTKEQLERIIENLKLEIKEHSQDIRDSHKLSKKLFVERIRTAQRIKILKNDIKLLKWKYKL